MRTQASRRALKERLRRRFRVVETTVQIAGRSLEILHPASAEDLIDEADFERDERLPYWAELWPSARMLGESVLGMNGGSRSLLELGCGSGLVTTCAALAGFAVTASDYYEDACRFACINADRNGGGPIEELTLDWRAVPADLPRFDVIVASDVLYERQYGALVAAVMARALERGGTAYLADPGRVGREEFVASLAAHRLRLRDEAKLAYVDGAIRQTIRVFEIGW